MPHDPCFFNDVPISSLGTEMAESHIASNDFEFPLVIRGSKNSLFGYLSPRDPTRAFRMWRIGILILITWVPLLLLAIVSGHASHGIVDVPLLHDPGLYGRFLFVLPLLELAELIAAASLTVQARQFLDSKLIPEQQHSRFDATVTDVIQLRSSFTTEISIAILAFCLATTFRLFLFPESSSNWEVHESVRSPAGWWYALISLPILFFFLLRWIWIYLLWSVFLFRVSRLDLQLSPTHPDHAGGLGFLGWGVASFSIVLMALSAMFSSGFYYEILHAEILHTKRSVYDFKYHMIVFVVIAIATLYAPLLVFFGRLSRCRFMGLLDFGSLVLRYDRKFEEKWIERKSAESDESFLGSSDIQSLADIASAYEHVNEMRLIPFDTKGFSVLIAAAVIPLIPLVATEVPLQEILKKLAEMMV